jgi:type IV secretion system protein VirB2
MMNVKPVFAVRRRNPAPCGCCRCRVAYAGQRGSASGTGMPWETPLNNILESVQGPVAKIIAVIVIITTG